MSIHTGTPRPAQPRLTIGMPVYNGQRYLPAALDSLLAQSYSDFELLINDNCSTDRSADIAHEYAARDPRVKVVRHAQNIGVTANYRGLVDRAQGELFRWAAVDDLCERDALRRCVDALDANRGAVLAYTRALFINDQGECHEDWKNYADGLHLDAPNASQRFSDCFNHVGMCNPIYGVIRTSVLRSTRGMGCYMGSDIVLLAELALHGTFFEVPEQFFLRRVHTGMLSSRSEIDQREDFAPGATHVSFMREWRHLWELWQGVMHAPIALSEKARATAFLSRRARWNRDVLARELWHRAADFISPTSPVHRRESA